MGEWMYISTYSWPRHQSEVNGQLHAPGALPPGESSPPYPFNRRLGVPQDRSGRCGEEKNLAPTETRTLTPRPSSPVASRYNDCAIPAPIILRVYIIFFSGISPRSYHKSQAVSLWLLTTDSRVQLQCSVGSAEVRMTPGQITSKHFGFIRANCDCSRALHSSVDIGWSISSSRGYSTERRTLTPFMQPKDSRALNSVTRCGLLTTGPHVQSRVTRVRLALWKDFLQFS
jgi:hypothetical protein